jgi:Na+-translocating ferredoxin:NAD+ oxidoreductase RnfD subunit
MSEATTTSRPKDPGLTALRRFAISITAFNIVGYLYLGFEQAYLTPVVAVLTAYATSLLMETVDAWARHRPVRYRGSPVNLVNFLLPAHIAGLACSMLLYGNDRLLPTVFAVTVAMASKYALRVRVDGVPRHLFNPSNLGISVTLLCFASWMAIAPPYEFTEYGGAPVDYILPAAILISGTMLNGKLTHRLPLIAGWLGGFVVQAVVRGLLFGDSTWSALLSMTGVAFILFTNYMITDPVTTPQAPRAQMAFGATTALVYGALVVAHITFGLFYALALVCAGRTALTWAEQRLRARRPAPALPVLDEGPAPETAPRRVAEPAV